jgi:D-glucosaminate-6-phosphate ammonia-lyase
MRQLILAVLGVTPVFMSIYQTWNVQPIINACGAVTRLGGAPMPPEALSAYREAASESVSLEQLQAAASAQIAASTNTEAGVVTSGAAAAMTLGTAAILCGHDLRRMEQLPNCDGFPSEFLIAREQRNGYDHAVRAAGAQLIEVGFNELVAGTGVRRTEAWEYEAAITPKTAGIVYVQNACSAPKLADLVAVANRHHLPVLVDAAAELPPRSNLQDIPGTGADLVAFSGGKAIRGPQATGILCGRKNLVSSAALQMLDMDDHGLLWDPPAGIIDRSQLNGMPRHGIGRAFKVSKEDIAALLTALDLFTSGAYDKQTIDQRRWLQLIADGLSGSNVSARLLESEPTPLLEIHIDESTPGQTAFEICRQLRNGSPSVHVGHSKLNRGILIINPACLNEDCIAQLIQGLRQSLS